MSHSFKGMEEGALVTQPSFDSPKQTLFAILRGTERDTAAPGFSGFLAEPFVFIIIMRNKDTLTPTAAGEFDVRCSPPFQG